MKPIASTLTHRIIPPEGSSPGVESALKVPALILLHGRGADEEDLLTLAPHLDDRLFLIAPRAPFVFPYGGYTWYDIEGAGAPEPGMFKESCTHLWAFFDDVLRLYPVDPARLFLLGFSMGAAMACAAGLSRPELFRGIASNSGYLPEETHLRYRWEALGALEFWIAHGVDDPVIPVAMARRTRDLLAGAGARCTYHEYPMGHEIGQQSLADLVRWMAGLL